MPNGADSVDVSALDSVDSGLSWQRYVHAEPVWGTVVTFDLRGPVLDADLAAAACRQAAEELHRIDGWMSPFRSDSAISAIRSGALAVADAPKPVREVLDACAELAILSDGAFDAWRQPGGVDPCGYVKGWGADRAAEILVGQGFAHVSVNAAGDVTCRGESAPGRGGWRIGVADPRDRQQVIAEHLVVNAHLATSGRYELGDHVRDPRTGQPVTGVDSATVLAADGGLADAWATALLVSGPAGLARLGEHAASAMVVTGGQVWTIGAGWAASASR